MTLKPTKEFLHELSDAMDANSMTHGVGYQKLDTGEYIAVHAFTLRDMDYIRMFLIVEIPSEVKRVTVSATHFVANGYEHEPKLPNDSSIMDVLSEDDRRMFANAGSVLMDYVAEQQFKIYGLKSHNVLVPASEQMAKAMAELGPTVH